MSDRRRSGTPRHRYASRWHWLLVVPVLVPLATPVFNRVEPALFGVPFFYWCQLAFVPFGMGVTATVHRLTRPGR
jgi:hypothetical protein